MPAAEGSVKDASASRIAIALSTEATDLGGTRSTLQERIALWTLWVAILSSAFYAINTAASPFISGGPALGELLLSLGPLLHLSASLWFAAAWLITRHVPLSLRTLRALDIAVLMVGCALYTWMGIDLSRVQAADGKSELGMLTGALACSAVVTSRAILVPSSALRTLTASCIAMAPLAVSTWRSTFALGDTINIINWCAVSIAIATVGSRVIFGLRTEAARIRRLGQYTLEEKIGAGGMGMVYRARHAMLRRPTAIKLLPRDRAGEANLLRFEREVQMTAELSHPNTVAIYDYGRTPDGIFYYAMEYLEGINLEQLVRRDGPLPAGRVIYILRQVCGALSEAHGRGLLHRDIKPANIILTERGGEPDVAKVVDFGLVKPLTTEGAEITLPATLVLAGTPLYMPPEALTSDVLDPRSDLYALGAVGYFLLAGHPIFEARTIAEAFGHHLHTTPVPPSERVAHRVPADLEAIVLRCLSKAVDDRPASARAMARELKHCADAAGWTTEHAAEWWRQFRAGGAEPAIEPVSVAEQLTVTVDLSERTLPNSQ